MEALVMGILLDMIFLQDFYT